MRFVYAIVRILLVSSVRAQQRFQGSIRYNLHTPDEKGDAELLHQFDTNKIKVKFREKDVNEERSHQTEKDSVKDLEVFFNHFLLTT